MLGTPSLLAAIVRLVSLAVCLAALGCTGMSGANSRPGSPDGGGGNLPPDAGPADADQCPGSCDDSDPCTTDTRDGVTCPWVCVHGRIEAPSDGDGCCPTGANIHSDDDCPAGC